MPKHKTRSVLIDTSSLLKLGLLSRNIVEACILYDELLIDGPSYHRNESKLHSIKGIEEFAKIVELNERDERHIYLRFSRSFNRIKGRPESSDLFRIHTTQWMADEIGAEFSYPSADWKDIESRLGDEIKVIAQDLRHALEPHLPVSGTACIGILRTFYYLTLQEKLGANLLLDSLKGHFYEPLQPNFSGTTIIDLFDETVRQAFYDRKVKWLGNHKNTQVKLPMLHQYVLSRMKEGQDVFDVIQKIRASKEARLFREGLSELQLAIETMDNQTVDEVFDKLETKANEWSRHISTPPKGRTINLTVAIPFLEAGTDFEVRPVSFRKDTGDKLLVFIHDLLLET